jgi:hypothetical protein
MEKINEGIVLIKNLKELPEIRQKDLYDWIEDYKRFLCSMIKFPEGQDHVKAVEKSLVYMGVIDALVQRIEKLEGENIELTKSLPIPLEGTTLDV